MTIAKVRVHKLIAEAEIPHYQHNGDAGVDLYSIQTIKIEPLSRALIQTGISLEIPRGFEGCIRPRSGNALNRGITVLNTPGTIDSNYRGEIGVILYNSNHDIPITIYKGERIAQLVIQELPTVIFVEADQLSETERGANGFGSTGM